MNQAIANINRNVPWPQVDELNFVPGIADNQFPAVALAPVAGIPQNAYGSFRKGAFIR